MSSSTMRTLRHLMRLRIKVKIWNVKVAESYLVFKWLGIYRTYSWKIITGKTYIGWPGTALSTNLILTPH